MIGLYLDTYTLSSALPDSFQISQVDTEYVEVTIELQGQYIYTTKLYPNNEICTFYELRQIVEQNMIKRNLRLASFEVMVDDGNGYWQYDDKFIIFSKYKNADYNDLYFLEHHFLTTRSYYTMPRNKYANVDFFATEQEQVYATYEATFERNGQLYHYQAQQQIRNYNQPFVYSIYVSPPSVRSLMNAVAGIDCGTLLSFTLHVGERTLIVYVVDDEPCDEFYFRNCYNTMETMFIFGTTTFKTEISKKEAVVHERMLYYDKQVTRKWEVKTAPMTMEEAMWFNEFLASDNVYKDVNEGYGGYTVLISDITSEISDSAKDRIHMKFSWRFDDNAVWIDNTPRERDFTPQFTNTYT